jgi:hypothetical protein
MHITPKPGLQVRDPITGTPLPAEGEDKPLTSYWVRRAREGSVTLDAVVEVRPVTALVEVIAPIPVSVSTRPMAANTARGPDAPERTKVKPITTKE